ncbi:OmpA family protein [Bacteroides xylanisolvens]|jgi:outer membrane protein OmpA-like peptidoglycan-associated protein|uniref:OmpA family protein n=1 Tax=Bacteroides faecis TaxID=674529 RepID=A0ABY5TIG0_9BACE|nr:MULTISPECIES: OmpA family protein [Bacteroides]MBV4223916.1 OmpA family protein [Bacteroides xylanisolvens]MCS2772912.1 OmpA family protein [Bacteroides thetaiotaomicron]MCS3332301.1 OmpA family protein [Bacteroides thetaiotaomicron]MDC1987096.1 OmpA family protein [Bacteroides uniformis]MDC1990746.1 OmpA family protein [Bacteroides uniformis]
MKKIIMCLSIVALASCKSNNIITSSNYSVSEKENVLRENNSCFSTVSIIGGASLAAEREKEAMLKKKMEKREKALNNIDGIDVTRIKDADGNVLFKAVVQNELLFAFDSFELSEDAKGILDKLIPVIEDVPDTKLKIIGHTDNIGGKSYNDNLSLNRAKSVASYLSAGGIDRNSIIEQGKGFSQPVADNTTEQGRAKNRRVEIFINNEIKQ